MRSDFIQMKKFYVLLYVKGYKGHNSLLSTFLKTINTKGQTERPINGHSLLITKYIIYALKTNIVHTLL